MTHYLKTVQPFFGDVAFGSKRFEVRKNDRDFKVGDFLVLQEYDTETDTYSGGIVNAIITYILDDLHCFWERTKIDAQLAQRRKEYDELSKQVEAKRAQLYDITALLAEKNRLSGSLTRLACDAISFGERVSKTM